MARSVQEIEARIAELEKEYKFWITKFSEFPQQFGVSYEDLYLNGHYQDHAGNLAVGILSTISYSKLAIESALSQGRVIQLDQIPEEQIKILFEQERLDKITKALRDYFDLLERFPEYREMEFFTSQGYFTQERIASVPEVVVPENHMATYIAASKLLLGFRAEKPQLDFIARNQRKEGYSIVCRTPNIRELDEMFGLYSGDGYGTLVDNMPKPASPEALEMLRGALTMTPMQCGSFNALSYFYETFVKRFGCFFALPYDEIVTQSNGNVRYDHLEEALGERFIRIYHHEKAGKDVVEVTTKFRPLRDLVQPID